MGAVSADRTAGSRQYQSHIVDTDGPISITVKRAVAGGVDPPSRHIALPCDPIAPVPIAGQRRPMGQLDPQPGYRRIITGINPIPAGALIKVSGCRIHMECQIACSGIERPQFPVLPRTAPPDTLTAASPGSGNKDTGTGRAMALPSGHTVPLFHAATPVVGAAAGWMVRLVTISDRKQCSAANVQFGGIGAAADSKLDGHIVVAQRQAGIDIQASVLDQDTGVVVPVIKTVLRTDPIQNLPLQHSSVRLDRHISPIVND